MTRIVTSADCGNSPKNIFLEKLTIAFAKGKTQFILESVTDAICWERVGQPLIAGKAAFAAALAQLKKEKVATLTIAHVMTHGKAGAVNGTRHLASGKTYAFCEVFEFSNAKGTGVQRITSYNIETP